MSEPIFTYLLVTIAIDPKDLTSWLPPFTTCYELVKAEPECVVFEVLYDDNTPGVFTFLEGWTKNANWIQEVQLKKPYYTPYVQATGKFWLNPPIIRTLERHSKFGYLSWPKAVESSGSSAYTFAVVAFYVESTKVETFLKALKETVYQQIIDEPECFIFEVLHSKTEPGTIRIVEGFKQSKEWFTGVQIEKSYYGPYIAATKNLWAKPREALILGRKEGFGYMTEGFSYPAEKNT